MAKSESTRGKGAKDGTAGRAASGASPGSGDGGAEGGATAKKSAAKSAGKTPAAKRAAALGTGGGTTGDTASGGGAAKRATAKKSAGGVAGAGAAKKRSGGAGGAAKKSSGGGAGGGAGHGLGDHLRQFARSRPQGWGHGEWLGLLEELRGHGHDVSDEGAVGRQLERERLVQQLEGVSGLGDRADALADRFGTLYSLRHAGVDEIAGVQGMDRQTAERIREHLR